MKKLLIIGLLLFEGVLICGMGARPQVRTLDVIDPVASVQFVVNTTDIPEPKSLTTEELIVQACEGTNVDPTIAVAISRLETGNWTSDAYLYGNNVGGLSRSEVPMVFTSLEEGISAFIACLETYFDKGLNTPELMSSVYCPPDPTGWSTKVRALMVRKY